MMHRTAEFLRSCQTFYIATVEKDQPRVRPFGALDEFEGKLYLITSNKKPVFAQLKANPKVEIVACTPDRNWLRYTGTAVFETDPSYAEAALEGAPYLRSIYNEETGKKLAVFYLTDAKAVKIDMAGNEEDLLG